MWCNYTGINVYWCDESRFGESRFKCYIKHILINRKYISSNNDTEKSGSQTSRNTLAI